MGDLSASVSLSYVASLAVCLSVACCFCVCLPTHTHDRHNRADTAIAVKKDTELLVLSMEDENW